MVKMVNKNGGNAQIEICYGIGHNSWEQAYGDDRLLNWMLSQNKRSDT